VNQDRPVALDDQIVRFDEWLAPEAIGERSRSAIGGDLRNPAGVLAIPSLGLGAIEAGCAT
jgi:hypothetical protein